MKPSAPRFLFVLASIAGVSVSVAASADSGLGACMVGGKDAPACRAAMGITDPAVSQLICAADTPLQRIGDPGTPFDKCPKYILSNSIFSLAGYNAPPSVVDGRNMPETHRTLYRGVAANSPQFSAGTAISAMLGDDAALIGSHLYAEIRDILLGKQPLHTSAMREKLDTYGISSSISYLTQCQDFGEREASLLAADLTNKAMVWLHDHRVIEPRFIDETSGSFDDYPAEMIYSSEYQALADMYGAQILEIAPSRSVDKHYWQFKNKQTGFDNHPPGDNGEFLTPGFVTPEEVKGYWLHESSDGDKSGIDWAFEKVSVDGKAYVLVLDAQGARCIENDGHDHFFYCKRNYGDNVAGIKPLPTIELDKELPVAAVIELCDPKTPCAPPSKLLAQYPKQSDRQLPDTLIQQIQKLRLGKGAAVAFTAKASKQIAQSAFQPAPCKFDANAVRMNNASNKVMSVCGKKNPCVYTVHASDFGNPMPGLPKAMKIEWTCSNAPEKFLTQEIEEAGDAEGKELTLSCPDNGKITRVSATYGGNIRADSKGNAFAVKPVPKVPEIKVMKWSHQGEIPGMGKCVQFYEPADPDTWDDNFLCFDKDYGFQWSSAGEIPDMYCTKIDEPNDPDTWDDNYLCNPQDFKLVWSHSGKINDPKLDCETQIDESMEPPQHSWNDNFLCKPKSK